LRSGISKWLRSKNSRVDEERVLPATGESKQWIERVYSGMPRTKGVSMGGRRLNRKSGEEEEKKKKKKQKAKREKWICCSNTG
jgi:hypothetical protein